jgi:putative flavoprotein involved in K+ transport
MNSPAMPAVAPTHVPVIVIGGGQAGLSVSWHLKQRGIEHRVIEKHRVGHAWRTQRWDSFCLVTPNWQCRLPGHPYAGDDPQGFMLREQIIEYVEDYARRFAPPLVEGVAVTRVARSSARYAVDTTAGAYTADQVVLAVGGYHEPSIPRLAERLDADIVQLHSSSYRNPLSLPAGAVLVVGTGQSGCQIAEDLHLAGRRVHLCVGSAPRSPRTYRGKDVVEWLEQMGYYDVPVHEHPQRERVRLKANHYLTGRDGGREIDLRRFALEGMQLHGRLKDLRGTQLHFGDDLARNLDQADATCASIRATVDQYIAREGIDAPTEPPYTPPWQPQDPPASIDYRAAGIASVIWCNGFKSDFRFVQLPVFDGSGQPAHERGVTPVPGLYFIGLPWLYSWGSGRFSHVARDAEHLAGCIEQRYRASVACPVAAVNALALGS